MIFDLQQGAFATPSQWHEYGVGFQAQLGIVGEEQPVWWTAEWPEPVRVNLLALSGTYDNQPQPTTAWKIEFRREGRWMTHARGVGGWYDRGYYLWGGPGTEPLSMDALRVSVFSRDDQTPIQSVHFRGEPGKSWIVAYCPPIAARIVAPDAPIRAAQPAEFSAVPLLGEIRSWSWDFGDEERTDGRTVRHVFTRTGHVEVGLRFSDGEHTDRIRRTVTVLPPVEGWCCLRTVRLPLMHPLLCSVLTARFNSTTAPDSGRRGRKDGQHQSPHWAARSRRSVVGPGSSAVDSAQEAPRSPGRRLLGKSGHTRASRPSRSGTW